jgi:hypothetical protein
MDREAIASAVAVISKRVAGDIDRVKGVDTKSLAHTCRASSASDSRDQ